MLKQLRRLKDLIRVKKDIFQELERLGSLKQQGLITEEEFQKLKMRLLSGIRE
jgi:Short C-terminal domain